MSLDEVTNLKSEILFGSSHCSCSSCDTLRCFSKRDGKPNECRCSICKEPTTCLYNLKKASPETKAISSEENQKVHKEVKLIHKNSSKKSARTKYDRERIYGNKNIVNIKVIKKNVVIQTQPQQVDDISVKCKDKNIQSQCLENDANASLVYLINKLITNYNNVSIQDVVDKIKAVCKTCSCKVCECILTTDNTICNCKPCECIDCKNVQMQIDDNTEYKNGKSTYKAPVSFQTPIIKSDNKSQVSSDTDKKVYDDHPKRQNEPCQCKPCDCDHCKIYNVGINDGGQTQNRQAIILKQRKASEISEMGKTKSYACKLVQCSKCGSIFRPSKNVIVAPVEEYSQNNLCSCSPCDCNDCRQNRSSVSVRGVRETSTGMLQNSNCQCEVCLNQTCRQTTGSCRCESQNSVISKPFENNKQNIDIHSAFVTKKISNNEQSCTISVLTDVVLGQREKVAKKVNYEDQKHNCITCENKNKTCPTESTSFCHIRNVSTVRVNDQETRKCQCSPCECKVCEKFKKIEQGVWKSEKLRLKCHCERCACILCDDLLKSKDIVDYNEKNQLPENISKESSSSKDRSVYLAMLYDVYDAIKINYDVRSTLSGNKAITTRHKTRVQNERNFLSNYCHKSNTTSFQSALSASTPTNKLLRYRSPENEHKKLFLDSHKVIDNKIVATFVNEIVRIEDMNNLNFYMKSASSQNALDDELSNNTESLMYFPEMLDDHSKCKNDKKDDGYNTKEKKESKEEIHQMISSKDYKAAHNDRHNHKDHSTKYDHSTNNRIVRQCLGKTNLVSKISETRSQNIKSESKLKTNSSPNEFELGSKIVLDKFLDEPNNNKLLQSANGNLEERKILFKSKLLTYELLKMLFHYEKANKEFQSVNKFNSIDDDHNSKEDIDPNRHQIKSSEKTNTTNLDLNSSCVKLAFESNELQTHIEKERISNESLKLSTEENIIASYDSIDTKKLNINNGHNKHFEKVSNDVMINKYPNMNHSELKCASQELSTISRKVESEIISRNSTTEQYNFISSSEKLHKRDEPLNLKRIRYVDFGNKNRYEVLKKKRYILIENIVARSEQHKSQLNEFLYI